MIDWFVFGALLVIAFALLFIFLLVDKAQSNRELRKMRKIADQRLEKANNGFFGTDDDRHSTAHYKRRGQLR
jgi:hypothetical protein